MAIQIPLFPTLTQDLKDKIRYQPGSYSFYYNGLEEHKLEMEEDSGSSSEYKIVDNEGIWAPDSCDLCIQRSYTLKTYQCLFGKDGVVCHNAILGIALRWKSKDSKQRGVIEIGELINSKVESILKLNYNFGQARLRGAIELSTILYVKEPGTPLNGEGHLADTYGFVLGELDRCIIKLDGNGSVFPIYEIYEKGQPLWYVKCEWDDPTYDQFCDSVKIYINKAHASYKYLDKSQKRCFNEQLLKEIMASALENIILKLRVEESFWDATITGINLERGSVSEAINYFINTLEWNVNSPETLSVSIRGYFDERMEKENESKDIKSK